MIKIFKNIKPLNGDSKIPSGTLNTAKFLQRCTLCPRECGANRFAEPGVCGGAAAVRINRYGLHFWEEPLISGNRGSGTIFFSHCALRCVYCQNYLISWQGLGRDHSAIELCEIMLGLQEKGAHNVNLVTASHYAPLAARAIGKARERGLCIPVVWNSSAYEKPQTLRLLEGLVDIYLPDLRYAGAETAARYSMAADYPEWAARAIPEMKRQVGPLRALNGIANRGLIIRLLVLPGQTDDLRRRLLWIKTALGEDTFVSLMGQYYPAHRAAEYPELNRAVNAEEYEQCLGFLDELGFENGFTQDVGSSAEFTPDFKE